MSASMGAKQLYDRAMKALEGSSVKELQQILDEINRFMQSSRFEELAQGRKEDLEDARKMLKEKIGNVPQTSQISSADSVSQHDPAAEALMNAAEFDFYGGHFMDAINKYEQVLQIEPDWSRAKEHKEEAERYLRTGEVPPDSFPAAAAIAFGKAQSAFRVRNFGRAKRLLEEAKQALQEAGWDLQQWGAGKEFEIQLHKEQEAQERFEEAKRDLAEGNWEEAINKAEDAFKLSGAGRYERYLQQWRDDWKRLEEIRKKLFSKGLRGEEMLDVFYQLQALESAYPGNPALFSLQERANAVLAAGGEQIASQIKNFVNRARDAVTLAEATENVHEAERLLGKLRDIEQNVALEVDMEDLKRKIEDQRAMVSRFEEKVRQAKGAKPWQQWKMLGEVQKQYPDDAEIAKMRRNVAWVGHLRNTGIAIAILLVLGALGIAFGAGWQRYRAYTLSLTPSPTPTSTMTPTATATPTLTPTATPTFTPTPTPVTMTTKHRAWARSGCYAGYPAVGHSIPAGSTVYLLPEKRRFDERGLECVLIEYRAGNASLIGWVLLADLEP